AADSNFPDPVGFLQRASAYLLVRRQRRVTFFPFPHCRYPPNAPILQLAAYPDPLEAGKGSLHRPSSRGAICNEEHYFQAHNRDSIGRGALFLSTDVARSRCTLLKMGPVLSRYRQPCRAAFQPTALLFSICVENMNPESTASLGR